MFEKFTERARRVIVLAQEEARSLGHNYVGTEHMLLALLREDEGVACKALESLGISLEEARRQTEEIIGTGHTPMADQIPFTPRAKKVLQLSLREALQLGHNYIGTEHILLGLLQEGGGGAARVLANLGSNLQEVRQHVVQLLSGAAPRSRAQTVRAEGFSTPLCPVCRSELTESAAYETLDVPRDDGTEGRSISFIFCGKCGATLGNLSSPEEGG